MKKQILIILIIGLFLINLVSALDIDNIKKVKETTGLAGYPDIEIKNSFGFGETLWSGTLESNTESCSNDCKAIQTITLGSKGVLINKVIFERIFEDGTRQKSNIRSYQILIKTGEQPYEVDDFKEECHQEFSDKNNTYYNVCEQIKLGTHTEYTNEWTPYILGTELDAGTYEVKLIGEKNPLWTYDWIYESQGVALNDWAVWGGVFDSNTVAYYKFDETSGTNAIDSVAGVNNGTTNALVNQVGILNKAYTYASASSKKTDFPKSLITNRLNPWSYNLWVYPTSTSGEQRLFSMRNDSLIIMAVGKSDDGCIATNYCLFYDMSWRETGISVQTNTWQMLSFTYNGTGINLYKNATKLYSLTATPVAPDDINTIGAGSGGFNYFNGRLDEFGIFVKELSQSEITTLYNGGSATAYAQTSTIVINSPENNYISPTSSVDINCTANVIGGATLTNMSLFHNASGSYVLNQTINAYSSTQTTENTGFVFATAGSNTGKFGIKVLAKQNILLNSITKDASWGVTKAYVYTSAGVLLDSASFSGNTATLSSPIPFTSGQSYYIEGDAEGASYNFNYDSTGGFTIGGTIIDITNSAINQADGNDNRGYLVSSLNFSSATSNFTNVFTTTLNQATSYFCQACDSDGACGYSNNQTVFIDTTAPTININAPKGVSTPNNGNLTLNVTIIDTNLESCWYNYNNTNNTFSCTSGVISLSNFSLTNQNNLTIYANDSVGNTNLNYTNWTWNIRINLKDTLGELISSPHTLIPSLSLDTYENPITRDSNYFLDYLNNYTRIINISSNAENNDYNGEIRFNVNQSEYDLSLTGKRITLNFNLYNGTPVNVTGFYTDGYTTEGFANSTFIKIQKELVKGIVSVNWAFNTSLMNYTQTYEYDNDWITNVEENMTLLNKTDQQMWIRIYDESGNVVSNALVKIGNSIPMAGGTYKEIGQRFTNDNGYVAFYLDSSSLINIRISKDGYETLTLPPLDAGETAYTYNSPKKIVLTKGDFEVYQGVYIRTLNYFNEETTNLPIGIYAPSREVITYNTNYRQGLGLGNGTITLNEHKQARYRLTEGLDYSRLSTNNLNITFWVDGNYWNNIVIPFQEIEHKLEEPNENTIDKNIEAGVGWIFMIIAVGVLGIIIKKSDENMGEGRLGKSFFMIGCLILSILFIEKFLYLLIIVITYGIMLIIRRYIAE